MQDATHHLLFHWWSGPVIGAALAEAAEAAGMDVLSVESEIFYLGRPTPERPALAGNRVPDMVARSATSFICVEVKAGLSKGIPLLTASSFAGLNRDRYRQFVEEAAQARQAAQAASLRPEFWLIAAADAIDPELPGQLAQDTGVDTITIIRLEQSAPPRVAETAGAPWNLAPLFNEAAGRVWAQCEQWNPEVKRMAARCRTMADLERAYEVFVTTGLSVPLAAIQRQNLWSAWPHAVRAMLAMDGPGGRRAALDGGPTAPTGTIWQHIQRLSGKEVPLLGGDGAIVVVGVSASEARVRKSTGSVRGIARGLIEGVAQETARRGRMSLGEILAYIGGRRHSSAIGALLVATGEFRHAGSPITIYPAEA